CSDNARFVEQRLRSKATLPEPAVAVVFFIRSASEMLIEALHEPAEVTKPLAPLVDDALGHLSLCLCGLPVAPAFDDRWGTKELRPALNNLLSAERLRSRLIDVHDEVIVIGQHRVRADLDREDRGELR